RSVERKMPILPALVYRTVGSVRPVARSNAGPAGRPDFGRAEIWSHDAPVSELRQIPRLVDCVGSLTATTMTFPRAAMAAMCSPPSLAAPSGVQVAPASVVRRTPDRAPPSRPRLLNRPIPATSVLCVVSVGSNARAPMERDAWLSVRGFQSGLTA